MTKIAKSSPRKQAETDVLDTTLIVRDPKTGRSVTVKGVGALANSGFKIRDDIDLVKPIYEQVFGKRSRKRKAR